MATLAHHRDQIAAITAGSEFFVFPDFLTDNLLVHNGTHGFVVTHICLDEWPLDKITTAVKEAVVDLRAGRDVDRNGVRFWSVEEMRAQGRQPCRFDETRVG